VDWVAPLHGHVVGLDTAPLIYFIEADLVRLLIVRPLFEALDRGEINAVTSTITLLEVLVQPLRRGDDRLAQQYRAILFNASGLTTYPVSVAVSEEAARLRAVHNLRTPDAIQMATALLGGATHFVTNDVRLPSIPGLQMLVLDRLAGATP